ncbi:MAG: transporter [Myxococcales bacterium]|nr:transporter [Myxococcales bacterium]MCB9735540.1 transporter [Deltaproteobacteria bacterium]
MDAIAGMLAESELLLLFVVVVLGVALGHVSVRGVRLGAAGVLFAGLGLSAWASTAAPAQPLTLSPVLKDLGLVLFVYCIGLASGPGFFRAFRERGVRVNASALAALAVTAAVAVAGGALLGLDRGQVSGVFCGSLTNTPALAAATERVQGTALATSPAIGYSVSYPFGVLGAILVLRGFARVRRRRLAAELAAAPTSGGAELASASFRVTNPEVVGRAIGELRVRDAVGVTISRLGRGESAVVPNKYTSLQRDDVVTAVGTAEALERALAFFGARSEVRLEAERGTIDMRRILVSRRELAGKHLSELELERRFNAQITRLRRADLDLLPTGEMRLELGDRLRVVAPSSRIREVSAFFGDSARDLAQIDIVALALGLCLGLLLARVPIPGPGGAMTLGLAGGPLVVALVLGFLGRTGRLVWTLPYEATTVLREIGLVIFLAGVGIGAGGRIVALPGGSALAMLGLGALVTVAGAVTMLVLCERWAGAGVIGALGATTGLQTQPATLAVAWELSGRAEETYVAYAVAYPVAMIGKVLVAQLLVMIGS